MSEPTPNPMPGKEVAEEGRRWRLIGVTRGAPGPMQEQLTDLLPGGPTLPYKQHLEVMPVSEHKARLAVEEARAERAEQEALINLRVSEGKQQVERTEYRVVASGSHLHGPHTSELLYRKVDAEGVTEELERRYSRVVVQERVVVEHPWRDITDA